MILFTTSRKLCKTKPKSRAEWVMSGCKTLTRTHTYTHTHTHTHTNTHTHTHKHTRQWWPDSREYSILERGRGETCTDADKTNTQTHTIHTIHMIHTTHNTRQTQPHPLKPV